jgi:hypothetical protein
MPRNILYPLSLFFLCSLPYLTLQRQSLMQQLERNGHEMRATSMELDLYLQSEDSDYDRED